MQLFFSMDWLINYLISNTSDPCVSLVTRHLKRPTCHRCNQRSLEEPGQVLICGVPSRFWTEARAAWSSLHLCRCWKHIWAIDRQLLLFVPSAGWQLSNWVREGLSSTNTHTYTHNKPSLTTTTAATTIIGCKWEEVNRLDLIVSESSPFDCG